MNAKKNLDNVKLSGRFHSLREDPIEAMVNGIALGAGIAGTALAVASVVLELPIIMGAAAGFAVVGAVTGLKRLRMLSDERDDRRSGQPDRRRHVPAESKSPELIAR